MNHILIIEDDPDIRESLRILLESENFLITEAKNGSDGLNKFSAEINLVILDIMMPGISGIQTCEEIRKRSVVPILFLTAKLSEEDKITGFTAGADDYLVKPFSSAELLARITVQLRKIKSPTSHILHFHDITLDLQTHKVYELKQEIKLTKTEYAILKLLMQNPSQVYTKSNILDEIRMDTLDCVESSLKVHISNLRRKLRSVSDQEYIEAVWGIGFKMKEN